MKVSQTWLANGIIKLHLQRSHCRTSILQCTIGDPTVCLGNATERLMTAFNWNKELCREGFEAFFRCYCSGSHDSKHPNKSSFCNCLSDATNSFLKIQPKGLNDPAGCNILQFLLQNNRKWIKLINVNRYLPFFCKMYLFL